MSVLYDGFMFWIVDLIINSIIIHDHFMVNGLYDDLWVILLNLFLRWCLLLGGDFVEISIWTTWVTNFLLLFFSFTFSFFYDERGEEYMFSNFLKICYFCLCQLSFSFWWWGGEKSMYLNCWQIVKENYF